MHPGPYLVIPFSDPRRCARASDCSATTALSTAINVARTSIAATQSWGLGVVNAVDQRANIDFRYYATGSPFEYETIRFLYVRKRLIEDAGLHKKRPRPRANPNLPAGE